LIALYANLDNHADLAGFGSQTLFAAPVVCRWLLAVLLWQNRVLTGWVVAMADEFDWWEASAEACFAEAEARIALVQETGSESLDLSGLHRLSAIPAGITRLVHLEKLAIGGTTIADLAQLATLTALQSLDCSDTPVRDLAPLVTLTALQSLDCSDTPVRDLAPLVTLTALQSLNCNFTKVSDLTPLATLTALQSLDCGFTQVCDLAPLATLTALQSLDCGRIRVSDLAPLAPLTALQSLDCSFTQVRDLAPLATLPALESLSIHHCQIQHFPPALIWRPGFENLLAKNTSLPRIPPEVLSQDWDDNCLPRLRAHLRDLEAGSSPITSAKLMLLGNGTVGKTQLCRRLRCLDFDPTIPSTHGVQVQSITHPQGEWHAWDFGGQDIYHSTHALFMRTRAVFVLVWSPASEGAGTHEVHGILFRNHPLEYWVQYVRHTAGTDCPLLIVQTRCEQAQDEAPQLPLPAGLLDDFKWRKVLQYSSQNNRGRAALDEALQDAHGYLLAQHPASIGKGRLRVQHGLCAWRDADAALPVQQRLHRLVSQTEFIALCDEGQGDVSDPAALLDFLHHTGIVFYRQNLFGNQIILDQGWALDAIYTVFEREKCWKPLRQLQGRFTRSLLASLIWDAHSEQEQELFLSMMCSCGVAFVHREGSYDKPIETEYIAPDLLPEKAAIEAQLEEKWDATAPFESTSIEYNLLQPGLLRAIVAKIGSLAGINGLYWQGGVCVYEQGTRSRALIEQVAGETGPAWRGQIQVKTQGPQAAQLLAILQKEIEGKTRDWNLHMEHTTKPAPQPEPPAAPATITQLQFSAEPAATIRYGVSYGWTADSSKLVNDLCQAAQARGITIVRDSNTLRLGDRIAPFMQHLAAQDRIFVILSDKYLKSPNCMYELFEIWRNARLNDADFLARVRVYRLLDADIFSPKARAKIATYWKTQFAELDAELKQHGADILGAEDFKNYKRMQDFAHHIGDILYVVADTLQPKAFDELLQIGFN
jgi:internalin A